MLQGFGLWDTTGEADVADVNPARTRVGGERMVGAASAARSPDDEMGTRAVLAMCRGHAVLVRSERVVVASTEASERLAVWRS